MIATLADPKAVAAHTDGVHELLRRMDDELGDDAGSLGGPLRGAAGFLAGGSYSLADPYATAALARFELHGHADWWQDGALPKVAAYYARVQQRPSWKAAGVVNTRG